MALDAKNPSLWVELAEVLRLQAGHMEAVGDALSRNNHDDLKVSLASLLQLVASRQPVMVALAPAIDALVQEVFASEEPTEGPEGESMPGSIP